MEKEEKRKELFQELDRIFKCFAIIPNSIYFLEVLERNLSKDKTCSNLIKDVNFDNNYSIWLDDKKDEILLKINRYKEFIEYCCINIDKIINIVFSLTSTLKPRKYVFRYGLNNFFNDLPDPICKDYHGLSSDYYRDKHNIFAYLERSLLENKEIKIKVLPVLLPLPKNEYKQKRGEQIGKLAYLVYEISYDQSYNSNVCEEWSKIANKLCRPLQEIIEAAAGCGAFGDPKTSNEFVTYVEFIKWYRTEKAKPEFEWFPCLPSWLEEKEPDRYGGVPDSYLTNESIENNKNSIKNNKDCISKTISLIKKIADKLGVKLKIIEVVELVSLALDIRIQSGDEKPCFNRTKRSLYGFSYKTVFENAKEIFHVYEITEKRRSKEELKLTKKKLKKFGKYLKGEEFKPLKMYCQKITKQS